MGTFDNNTKGILEIPRIAHHFVYEGTPKIVDPVMESWLEDNLVWDISNIGDSHADQEATALTWSQGTEDPNLGPLGIGIEPTATFTGLPYYNDDFGPKIIRMGINNQLGEPAFIPNCNSQFEVFFPRDQYNHPDLPGIPEIGGISAASIDVPTLQLGTRSPNWFFYWKQATPGTEHARFYSKIGIDNVLDGMAPKMALWYSYEGIENRILIGDNVPFKWLSHDKIKVAAGIDYFYNIVIHENCHIRQIIEHNALNPHDVSVSKKQRTGWSWSRQFELIPKNDDSLSAKIYNHFLPHQVYPNLVVMIQSALDADTDGDAISASVGISFPDQDDAIYDKDLIESQCYDTFIDYKFSDAKGLRNYDWGKPGKQHGLNLSCNVPGEVNCSAD